MSGVLKLRELCEKYAQTPWFAKNRQLVETTRQNVNKARFAGEAESLYAKAEEAFRQKQPFDLRPLVEALKSQYGNSAPVTDPNRKPSFAEMQQAVANLGKVITVRKDGKGDFTRQQLAFREGCSVDRQGRRVATYGLLAQGKSPMLTGEYSMFP